MDLLLLVSGASYIAFENSLHDGDLLSCTADTVGRRQ